MFHKILFSICLTIFSFSSIAQNDSPHHIGVSAGVTTGAGLSYRYWPSKLGFQVTALPSIVNNNGSVTSLGASILYTLNDSKVIDLYSYLGNSIIYMKSDYYSEMIYNSGIGFGLKFEIFDELNINTQLGYGGIDISGKNSTFSIIGEIGLYYNL